MTTTDAQSAKGDSKSTMPSPPPTYAQVVAARKTPAQAPLPTNPDASSQPTTSHPHPDNANAANSFGQPTPSSPPPRTYGPTPLPNNAPAGRAETTTILPYYDPRSQWALREAVSRARWRFFGALFWGCIIWAAVGSLIGGAVDNAGRRSRHGSWAVE